MIHPAKRWPFATFVVLACAFTWALLPFTDRSVAFSLVALLGPALAAWITAALGAPELRRDLRARVTRWRVPPSWYFVALLLPLPVTAARSALEWFAGAEGPIRFQSVSTLGLVVFVLVAGEEIGWRGFALPRLLGSFRNRGAWQLWVASAGVGIVWAVWHLPLFRMPSMPQFGTPFLSYVPYLVALSAILTFLSESTRGSVLVATLFHGSVNTFGWINTAASAELRGWCNALCYTLAAVVLHAILRRSRLDRATGA